MPDPLDYQSQKIVPAVPKDPDGVSGKWVIAVMGVISLLLAGLIIWLVLVTHRIPQ